MLRINKRGGDDEMRVPREDEAVPSYRRSGEMAGHRA